MRLAIGFFLLLSSLYLSLRLSAGWKRCITIWYDMVVTCVRASGYTIVCVCVCILWKFVPWSCRWFRKSEERNWACIFGLANGTKHTEEEETLYTNFTAIEIGYGYRATILAFNLQYNVYIKFIMINRTTCSPILFDGRRRTHEHTKTKKQKEECH